MPFVLSRLSLSNRFKEMSDLESDQKLAIIFRNLFHNRGCGSIDELKNMGGVHTIASKLKFNLDSGLTPEEVTEWRAKYGSKHLQNPHSTTYFGFLVRAAKDYTIIMLFGAAVIALVLAFA